MAQVVPDDGTLRIEMDDIDQRAEFVQMTKDEGLDLHELWVVYKTISGTATIADVSLYWGKMIMLPQSERDLLWLAASRMRDPFFRHFKSAPDDA
ncbi:hypothetical protein D6T65_15190 [Arthrobacter frigidicola]|nr:hypothetical protein D6T65_15190 [Arthrobacter frigidicola]